MASSKKGAKKAAPKKAGATRDRATKATQTGSKSAAKRGSKVATRSPSKSPVRAPSKAPVKAPAKAKKKSATKSSAKRGTAGKAPARKGAGAPKPSPWFEIRRSAIQGRGAFATRRIPRGTRIIEYTGERVSQEEANRRYDDDSMSRHHTFLFTLDEHTVIDGKRKGNDSRYINHSCDPNCEAIIEDDRIFVHAKKNIQPGTELTFDYKYERTEAHTDEDEQFYACRCGSPKCRGTILAPKKPARRGRAKA